MRTIEELMQFSDNAMYKAKNQGRGNYQFYTAGMKAEADKVLLIETSLSQAIDRDQFVLHYQPQYDMRSGKLAGLEALVRWEHPERGLISPADFIPIAEETGLILPLGNWVLNRACQDHKSWLERGMPPVRMAVNISPRQFHHDDLLNSVKQALHLTGLDASMLEIEITETSIMHDATHAIGIMHQLRNLAVTLAIDDFGTGYSSLKRLKDYPISKIKIDRTFIMSLEKTGNSSAIVKAIISLADNLGLEVIAEGVETLSQAELLQGYGCWMAQGFYYSRPQPAERINEMFCGDFARDELSPPPSREPLIKIDQRAGEKSLPASPLAEK